jgi:hypothetical protein
MEIHMKTTGIMAVAVIIVGSGLALHLAWAQQAGTRRTDLQRHDLSAPGREVVQVRVGFDPGMSPQTLASRRRDHRGDVLFVPARAIHSAKNVGSGNGAELATYVVEKGLPLLTLVK